MCVFYRYNKTYILVKLYALKENMFLTEIFLGNRIALAVRVAPKECTEERITNYAHSSPYCTMYFTTVVSTLQSRFCESSL